MKFAGSGYFVLSPSLVCLALVAVSAPTVAAPGEQGRETAQERHERIVSYWTRDRIKAAKPRDLKLDAQGRGYLDLGDGWLRPYGWTGAPVSLKGGKPGGGDGGGGGGADATPPVVSEMSPAAGATIGANEEFTARVTDNVSVRSVSFSVRKGSSRAQKFAATLRGDNIWGVNLQGFSDGNWSWRVEATDGARNKTTTQDVQFVVDSGGGTGSGDTVTNARWTQEGQIKQAAGRIYFEMPSGGGWAGYVCSGTVVTDGTSGRSIILTAAHCVYDDSNKKFARNVLFIPNQDDGGTDRTDGNCSNDPYGCWTPGFGVVDSDWASRTWAQNIPWDYAFYVVSDSGAHSGTTADSRLDVAVGSLPVSFVAPSVNDGVAGATSPDFTRALGYSYSNDPWFMYCAEDMTTNGSSWWLPSCGLSSGASGGPWIQKGNGGLDEVMSVNSYGYSNAPGMGAPRLNGTSASCLFDAAKSTPFGDVSAVDGAEGITPQGC